MRWIADATSELVLWLIAVLLALAISGGCAVDKYSLSCQPQPLEITITMELSK